jgi:hypothetical protein
MLYPVNPVHPVKKELLAREEMFGYFRAGTQRH